MTVRHWTSIDPDTGGAPMARILIVDDEPDIADFLRRGLAMKGYTVDVASDGQSGLDLARDLNPDLVILDLMLPDIDGVEVCRRIRAAVPVPIIMVTARDAVPDRVAGLDAGADDYVTKPFAFDELLARVRAAFRRQAPAGQEVIKVGDLLIKPASREVSRAGRPIQLTTREYELLEFLARHQGQVLTKEMIFSRVWGYDLLLESDAIKVYVRYLRRKLNAEGEPDLIHSVRGIGYMLKATDERPGTPAEPSH
jgi:two-component system response regulator MprA